MILNFFNHLLSFFVVSIAVITYIIVKYRLDNYIINHDSMCHNKTLLISITSAQENFEQRKSIRNTWLKLVDNYTIKYCFLVGKRFCHIPPRYRLSPTSCDEWKPNISSDTSEETTFNTFRRISGLQKENDSFSWNKYMTGFSFILNHPILIKNIGIHKQLLSECHEPIIRVSLFDLIEQKKIFSSTFGNYFRNIKDSIIWKNVKTVALPLGFEGKLILETNSLSRCNEEIFQENINNEENFTLSDETYVIRFLQAFFNNNSSMIFTNNLRSHLGFSFSLNDADSLIRIINNREKEYSLWQQRIVEKLRLLKSENDIYQDILFLDMVDVYRNLPIKMLQFFKWFNNTNNFEYILKTDDDVFINIPMLSNEIDIRNKNTVDWNWWSCFRVNWPVRKAGKWRDLSINLDFYPTFPSGAGYVLHKDVITYIVRDLNNIQIDIQGEDVALGLWLKDYDTKLYHGHHCHWSCNNACHKSGCNLIELNTTSIYDYWQKYSACNYNFCWC